MMKKSLKQESKRPYFVFVADGSRHSIGIDELGIAFSWGRSNSVGQLGRSVSEIPAKVTGPINLGRKAVRAFVSEGSDPDAGHSAIIDDSDMLWMTGCDRWQQLGLGSSKGGSTGYTWKDGLWQERFVQSSHVIHLMKEKSAGSIRDVSLGGDHTLVLASNGDVYAFGKGGDGQLGLHSGKPFVSAPVKSTKLSGDGVSAVCAVRDCSITLNKNGSVQNKAGKCNHVSDQIFKCMDRARKTGLVNVSSNL